MAPESDLAEHSSIKTGERLPVTGDAGTEAAAPEINQDLSYSRPHTIPHKEPSALDHADRGTKERLATGLQRQKGNAYVQRMIQRKNQGNPASRPLVGEEPLETHIQAAPSGGQNLETGIQKQLESGGGSLTVSDPSTARVQVAEQTARHIPPVARQAEPHIQRQASQELTQAPRSTSSVTRVQRYQAGDTGHGGIEEKALTDVGFTADEASKIYFGNWLRDLSQVPPEILPLVNIVALGEFNRTITQQDLGTYVPSEHLDNPTEGGTIEDRPNHAPAMTDEKADEACREHNLSGTQCAEFKDEEHHREDILKASADSHLPVYIERGKYHAKKVLEKAIAAKRTQEGMSLMGNALHAIEDYFSHSNFVEAAILTLKKEGVGGKKVDTLVDQMKKTQLGDQMVKDSAKAGVPEIVTGTYKGTANKTVTELEIFKSEIAHGQLTRAFMLGLLRQGGIGIEELGKRLGEVAGGVTGGVLGGILGGVGGAVRGYEREKENDSGTIGQVVGGLLGGIGGAVRGYRKGAEVGREIGGGYGQAVGYFLDKVAVLGIDAIVGAFYLIGIVLNISQLNRITDAIVEWRVKANTEESKKEAPTDPETGKKGPSHSELAKDAPDHPLFAASSYLATEVDKEFGIAMQSAWAAAEASPGTSPDTKPVTDLVDKFVSVPSHDPWWRTKLLESIK